MTILETRGLGKDYGRLTAVRSLDLVVEPGEILGLLGPNGAGKTSAISMVAGVLTPSRGSAKVAGHDIRDDAFAARRELGLVPQDIAIYPELSARENLRFFGGLYGLRGAVLEERMAWALAVAGLTERAYGPVSRFSGGMKRRLNLVCGLLHRPKLLILDEPTVGVDPQSRNHIFETILALRRDHGIAVVYTSHYMEEVATLCERVAIIDHGELVALDTVSALLASRGATEVEMELKGDLESAAAAIRSHAEVTEHEGKLRFPHAARLGPIVRAVEAAGCEVVAVRTLESNLEDVFLGLTGHSLRDEAS
jgi:ABC-2 type transport system ATP-binding protein